MEVVGMQASDLFQWLVSIPAFIIVFVMIDRIVIEPMKDVVRQRAFKVQSRLAEAEKILVDARKLEAQYREQFSRLPADSDEMRANARREVDRVRQRTLTQAVADAGHLVDRARRDGEKYRQEVLGEVQRRTTGLAMERAESLLRNAFDAQAQTDMAQQFLGKVDKLRAS